MRRDRASNYEESSSSRRPRRGPRGSGPTGARGSRRRFPSRSFLPHELAVDRYNQLLAAEEVPDSSALDHRQILLGAVQLQGRRVAGPSLDLCGRRGAGVGARRGEAQTEEPKEAHFCLSIGRSARRPWATRFFVLVTIVVAWRALATSHWTRESMMESDVFSLPQTRLATAGNE